MNCLICYFMSVLTLESHLLRTDVGMKALLVAAIGINVLVSDRNSCTCEPNKNHLSIFCLFPLKISWWCSMLFFYTTQVRKFCPIGLSTFREDLQKQIASSSSFPFSYRMLKLGFLPAASMRAIWLIHQTP